MTIVAGGIAIAVFGFFGVLFVLAGVLIVRKVFARSKEAGVNLKDGVSSDELAVIGRLLAEEAKASKELELLVKLKDIAEKALVKKAV